MTLCCIYRVSDVVKPPKRGTSPMTARASGPGGAGEGCCTTAVPGVGGPRWSARAVSATTTSSGDMTASSTTWTSPPRMLAWSSRLLLPLRAVLRHSAGGHVAPPQLCADLDKVSIRPVSDV